MGNSSKKQPVPAWRAVIYSTILTVLVFGAVELVLALAGIRPAVATDDPFAGFNAHLPLFVEGTGEDAGYWVTAPNKHRFFNHQRFTQKKSPTTRRVFCLGGSTTYGRPYGADTAFSAWLAAYLQKIDPAIHWEVINAGGISYASYRVASVMRELAKHSPDIFVVYTGHNEFLEERTYGDIREQSPALQALRYQAQRIRLYALMEKLLARRSSQPPAQNSGLRSEVHTRLDSSIGPDAYSRDDVLHDDVLRHFEDTLRRMAALAESCGAELVLVTPACSLNDCSPFKSHCENPLHVEAVDRRLAAGRDALRSGAPGDAIREAHAALDIEPRHAHAHYALGRALLHAGDNEAARRAFEKARDEDIVPLRAPRRIIDAVRRVALESDIPLVDYEQLIAAESLRRAGHGSPGQELFLDHVHPTIDGHGLLGRALADLFAAETWVRGPLPLSPTQDAAVAEAIRGRVDPQAEALAFRNLAKVLSWAGKTADAARLAERSLTRIDEDAESLFIVGLHAYDQREWDQAAEAYMRAIASDPTYAKAHHNLALTDLRLGRVDDAIRGFETVLDLDPGHPNACFNLARALTRADRHGEALEYLDRYLVTAPGDADAHFLTGSAHLALGNPAGAMTSFRRCLSLRPDDAEAHYELALLELASGNEESARQGLQTAITLAPKWSAPRDALSQLPAE